MSNERALPVRVLMIATSQEELGQTGHKTGLWLEELAAPYRLFQAAGFAVTLASPNGGAVPLDPTSLSGDFLTPEARAFQADAEASVALAETGRLTDVGEDDFDALFFTGGHGTMWDFFPNAEIARLLAAAGREGKPVAAVCHGVTALLNGMTLEGVAITGFSNAEEAAVGLSTVVPHLLEDSLRAAGAAFRAGPIFAPHVVEAPGVMTGQNPASSTGLAAALIRKLGGRA